MNQHGVLPLLAAVSLVIPARAAQCTPAVSLLTGDRALPLTATPAQFAKASGFILRLTMVHPGKAGTIVKVGKLAFLVESKEQPGSTFRLVRFEFDEKKGRIVTMGSSKLSPAKNIEYPAPAACLEFEVIPGEKPGIWKVTPRKELPEGQYGLYVYHSRGLSFDAIQANLFEFAVE